MLHTEIVKETSVKTSGKFFKQVTDRLYNVLSAKIDKVLFGRDGFLDLVLVDDVRIRNLNKEFRGEDKSTDVISFAYLDVTDYEADIGDIIVGDIFISVDTAKRQAKENNKTLNEELEVLFVHGLLHLFGFNHRDDKEEKEMEKVAKKVIGK